MNQILDPRQPENGTYGLPAETAVDVAILPNTGCGISPSTSRHGIVARFRLYLH